jgi:hypothetical protein
MFKTLATPMEHAGIRKGLILATCVVFFGMTSGLWLAFHLHGLSESPTEHTDHCSQHLLTVPSKFILPSSDVSTFDLARCRMTPVEPAAPMSQPLGLLPQGRAPPLFG